MTRAKLIREGMYWAVIDHKGRHIIREESYGVASAVESAFNAPMAWQPTEAYGIADAHHAALRQWEEE